VCSYPSTLVDIGAKTLSIADLQALWIAVMGGKNPSHFKEAQDWPERPVDQVSWDDVQGFLEKLKQQLPSGSEPALPSEAQWEYAARAGTKTAYEWGDEPDSGKANWSDEHDGTTAVKTYAPNGWGLYDVHGNVWEWCEGYHRTYAEGGLVVDPSDAEHAAARALRGGSWLDQPRGARAAFRRALHRDFRHHFIGFRLALRSTSPDQQEVRRTQGVSGLAGELPRLLVPLAVRVHVSGRAGAPVKPAEPA
jgi:formylglycine-generating enzyme